MFKRKEENMPKINTHDVNNFGELMYRRKTSVEFSIEMNTSIKEGIKHFTK